MDEVLEFIHRRFKTDCDWLCGNCYYFALILKAKFPRGRIYYDPIDGHFIFLYREHFYDWSGIVTPSDKVIPLDLFPVYDLVQYKRVMHDCLE